MARTLGSWMTCIGGLCLLLGGCGKEPPSGGVTTPPSGETVKQTGGGEEPPEPPPKVAGPGTKVDPATAATLTGKAHFKGARPKMPAIDMSGNPECAAQHGDTVRKEAVIVNENGTLKNVFVYVKKGEGVVGKPWDIPSEPVVLDQKGCMYLPHVLGIMVGQKLQIVNSDPTGHNVHWVPKINASGNRSQAKDAPPIEHVFTTREVMVPFKCDVHGWMNAWISVLDHPFYSVTNEQGDFEIKGLPPGKYTIEACHEDPGLGRQTQDIELKDKESKAIEFAFEPKK